MSLENQTNTLDEEYSKLMLYLSGNDTKSVTLPSVTSLRVRSWRMSDNLQIFIHSIMNVCINMESLYIDIISEPTYEVDRQRNSLLKLMMNLNPIEELTLSMDCCLLSAVLGEQGKYVNAKYLHLELSKCHFVNDSYLHMAREMWHQYREWIFGSKSNHISSHNCRIVPVDNAFKNLKMLHSLTVDSPINDGDFKVLLNGLKHLQHFRIISADKRTVNQILEYLSQNTNLKTLEISHASLGNSEIEKLCEYLPQNMLKFGLYYMANLDEYQVSLLSDALKNLDKLTSLDLSADYIDNKSLKYLLNGLKSNRHLHSLDLSFNEINEEHIELLSHLQTLHHLNIQGHALSPTCKDSLMRMLYSLSELRSFYSCILFFYANDIFHHVQHDADDLKGGEDSGPVWNDSSVFALTFSIDPVESSDFTCGAGNYLQYRTATVQKSVRDYLPHFNGTSCN